MENRKLLVVSTSKIYGSAYMEYLLDEVKSFFSDEIVFIPFARPGGISHDDYTEYPRKAFEQIGIKVKGLHEFSDPKKALKNAKGIFTGGGNTFVLLKQLYDLDLVDTLKELVRQKGTPYMGSSAGSNICGLSISTTNDMPIVYPPSFKALNFLDFNINPHYLDPEPDSKHQGETREIRINEFHHFNDQLVLGLREGSWLRVEGESIELKGELSARVFRPKMSPEEVEPGILSFLS